MRIERRELFRRAARGRSRRAAVAPAPGESRQPRPRLPPLQQDRRNGTRITAHRDSPRPLPPNIGGPRACEMCDTDHNIPDPLTIASRRITKICPASRNDSAAALSVPRNALIPWHSRVMTGVGDSCHPSHLPFPQHVVHSTSSSIASTIGTPWSTQMVVPPRCHDFRRLAIPVDGPPAPGMRSRLEETSRSVLPS